jgi:hypothetical protein
LFMEGIGGGADPRPCFSRYILRETKQAATNISGKAINNDFFTIFMFYLLY